MVRALEVRLTRSLVQPQVIHAHVPLLAKIGICQTAAISCSWEGNRRSVVVVVHYRVKWFIYLQTQGLSKGDEHPAYTTHGVSTVSK